MTVPMTQTPAHPRRIGPSVATVACLTARLAPGTPKRHVFALIILGFPGSLAGAIATIPMDIGPTGIRSRWS